MKNKLENIVDYLNQHFNQNSEEYSIFMGAKPQIIRFDQETAISLWACGAIVCVRSSLFFIQEDDGNWYAPKYINSDNLTSENLSFWKKNAEVGVQTGFSLGWGDSFLEAFQNLNTYVKENGSPYYYTLGTDENGNPIFSKTICGYELK